MRHVLDKAYANSENLTEGAATRLIECFREAYNANTTHTPEEYARLNIDDIIEATVKETCYKIERDIENVSRKYYAIKVGAK